MTARLVRVGDIADQVRGVNYSKSEGSTEPCGGCLPIVRAGNIVDGRLRLDNLVYVPERRVSRKQRLRRHDVVVATSSGSLDVVGKAATAAEDLDVAFGAFCKVLRPSKDVHPRYFAHFFQTVDYRARMSRAAAGANINNLRAGDLDNLEIPLPRIEDQRRIAAILDQAEDLGAKRQASLAMIDSLNDSIFFEMFGDPAVNPDGHELRPLADVVAPGTIVTYGIVQAGPEHPGGIPYIRTGDIIDGRILAQGLRHTAPSIAEKFGRSRVRVGEIVMSIRATVGTTAVVPLELDGANLTQGTARIAPGPDMVPSYLLAFLRTAAVQQWILRQVKGATFREITLNRLRELTVMVPTLAAQREFGSRVDKAANTGTSLATSADRINALFLSLQQRAFAGQL